MIYYYDIIPYSATSIYETTEAIEEATRKILLVDSRCQIDHIGGNLPLGIVRLCESDVKKINLPMAKLVKCEGQQ
tara:strand:+ start:855 stop:1079 length:225 start_codon:yes stop_codon:yes gene_type:complete